MRTFEELCRMTEKALDKASEANEEGAQGAYGIHLTAAQCFSQLALAMSNVAAAAGKLGVEPRRAKGNENPGYL